MSQLMTIEHGGPSAWRRLGAMIYDALALAAIWFFATLVVVVTARGEAIAPGNPFYTGYLVVTAFLYFGTCWTRSGQTLGMKSWRFAVVGRDGHASIGWPAAAVRFAGAIVSLLAFGLGFLWPFIDRERRSWHDMWSRTCLRDVNYPG